MAAAKRRRNLLVKPCEVCRRGFSPLTSRHLTCGPECRAVLKKRRINEWYARNAAAVIARVLERRREYSKGT